MNRLAPVVSLLLLAGCTSSVRVVTRAESTPERCYGITSDRQIHYAICGGHRFVRNGKPLPIEDPPGAKIGHWAKAFLSPDGKTFLAQWSAECEVPFAFFVPVNGGLPRVVTGEGNWPEAPESIADGWTADGRAIVELPTGECGNSVKHPGVYIVHLDGRRKLVAPLSTRPGS